MSEIGQDRLAGAHDLSTLLRIQRVGMVAAVERVIQDIPRLGGRGYGLLDVEIYARQGRKELALATLRAAVDEGWQGNWWSQAYSAHNDSIKNEPEFVAIMDEIRAEMAVQLESVRRMEARGELTLP